MRRIYSNRKNDSDEVMIPFLQMLEDSERADLASPFFTSAKPLLDAANDGKTIRLLIELNVITCPKALREIIDAPNITIKYLMKEFHAKVYVFDKVASLGSVALLGSANLTGNGLTGNREAVIRLCEDQDSDAIQRLRKLFDELWEAGDPFDEERLVQFEAEQDELRKLRAESLNAKKRLESVFPPVIRESNLEEEFKNACERVFGAIARSKVSVNKRPQDPEMQVVEGLNVYFYTIRRFDGDYTAFFLPESWVKAMHKDGKHWSGTGQSGFFRQPLMADIRFLVKTGEVRLFGQLVMQSGTVRDEIRKCIEYVPNGFEGENRRSLQERIGFPPNSKTTDRRTTFFKKKKFQLNGTHHAGSLAEAMKLAIRDFTPAIKAIGDSLANLDLSS